MPKKNVVKLLCMGALIAGLLFGCGRSQPAEIAEDEEVTAEIAENEEVTEASVDDLATEAEIREKDGTFDKIKDKKTKAEAYEVYTEETSEEEDFRQTDCEELLGIWALTFDYSTVIESELTSDFDGFHEDFDLTICLIFNNDGTFEMYIDEDALAPELRNYLESLAQFDVDSAYEEYEAHGMSRVDIDEGFQEMYGMTPYEYALDYYLKSVTAEEIASEFYISGVYQVKGNQLHMDENAVSSLIYDIFTIEGDTLTLTPPEGAEVEYTGIEGFDYPYVFTRVVE